MFDSKKSIPLKILLIGLIFGCAKYNVDALDMSTRIVSGTNANILEFPYMISLKGPTEYHICGGSILNAEWIMTAAHCIIDPSPTSFSVQYGVTNITKTGDTVMKIDQIIVHEDFNSHPYENDIALLHLVEPLEFNERVQPIKLPVQGQYTPNNVRAVVIGWGMNATGGSYQQNLQKVELSVLNYEICEKLNLVEFYPAVYSTNICAGVSEGDKGQCEGDSGGPLIHDGYQIGIVSWSIKPCTIKPYPGVYTKVASYRNWIRDTINY